MPYLIGIPAPQLLRGLEHMGLEEVVFVDLDAGTCRLGSQDGQDMDHALLPWAHHLQAAFQVCLTAMHALEGKSWAKTLHCVDCSQWRVSGERLAFLVMQMCCCLDLLPTKSSFPEMLA